MKRDKQAPQDAPAMPFNEALKRVWSHAPMPKAKAKPKPAEQANKTKPAK